MKHSVALARTTPHAHWMTRSLIGGAAWGLALTAGLTGMDFAQCGAACIDTTAMTAVLSVALGIIAMAAFTRHSA